MGIRARIHRLHFGEIWNEGQQKSLVALTHRRFDSFPPVRPRNQMIADEQMIEALASRALLLLGWLGFRAVSSAVRASRLHRENSLHAVELQTTRSKENLSNLSPSLPHFACSCTAFTDKRRTFSQDGKLLEAFDSRAEAAKRLAVGNSELSDCPVGRGLIVDFRPAAVLAKLPYFFDFFASFSRFRSRSILSNSASTAFAV